MLRYLRQLLGHDQHISIQVGILSVFGITDVYIIYFYITYTYLQTSTSLQHVPYDVRTESSIDPGLLDRLSFATQKLRELSDLVRKLYEHPDDHQVSNLGEQKGKEATFERNLVTRSESYEERRVKQYQYPPFPTTSIGSFPQTPNIRRVRLQFKKSEISDLEYKEAIAAEIGYCIGIQEAIDMDVFVHGEAERSDMVRIHMSKV